MIIPATPGVLSRWYSRLVPVVPRTHAGWLGRIPQPLQDYSLEYVCNCMQSIELRNCRTSYVVRKRSSAGKLINPQQNSLITPLRWLVTIYSLVVVKRCINHPRLLACGSTPSIWWSLIFTKLRTGICMVFSNWGKAGVLKLLSWFRGARLVVKYIARYRLDRWSTQKKGDTLVTCLLLVLMLVVVLLETAFFND